MEPCVYFLYSSHLLYGICVNIFIMNRYISGCYTRSKDTIYGAGAAVVSTITSCFGTSIWSRWRHVKTLHRFRLAKQKLCTCITPFLVATALLHRENVSFHFLWRTWTQVTDFLFFSELRYNLLVFTSKKRLPTFGELNRDRMKFEAAQIHLLSDVFVTVAVAAVVVD